MKAFKVSFLLYVLIFIFPFSAKAAESPIKSSEKSSASKMPEVVVKAAPIPLSLTVPSLQAARRKAALIPGGTSVVDAENYKTGRAAHLQDILGYTPGVYIQPRFGSEEARLSIRGSGIQRTFHLRGIKLLQDGVPINQADGGGDFQAIEPLALQYAEVMRGANALEYGSTTLGGAVNFVSPTGYDAPLIQGRFEVGSFNYLRDQISSGSVAGPLDYYVSLSEFRQKGFRNHSDQDTKRLFSNYGFRWSQNAETRFYVSLVESKSKLPGSLTLAQMKQNPKQPNPANTAGNQKRDFDLVRIANKTSFRGEDQLLEIGSYYIHKDLFHPIFQVIDQVFHDFGASFRYQNKADFFSRKNILTLGFNPVWNLMEVQQSVNVGGDRGALTAKALQRSYNLDLYGENQFYAMDRLALVTGIQGSLASRKTFDKFLSNGNHSGHPTYAGISPKLGARYELNEHSQIFANVSRSFEPPSFGELSNVTGGGIADLTEQMATTLELGTRGQEGRFSWDMAYYYSWADNELLSLSSPEGTPLGTVNTSETRHHGIEAGFGFDLLRGIFFKKEDYEPFEDQPGFNAKQDIFGIGSSDQEEDRLVLQGIYNWSRFRFKDDPAFSDNPLPGIPQHFVRAELSYRHPSGFYFGPNAEFASKFSVDMNHTLFTYPYAILGLKGGYRTKKGISFFVEAKNLTNEIYAATSGVIANAGGADAAQFFPGEGRAVMAGIEYRWGD